MMDAAGPEAALRDLEAAALAEQHVGGGDAHAAEHQFGVAERRMLVAVDRQRRARPSGRARPSARGSSIAACVWAPLEIALAHHDRDLAGRRHRAGDPPFAAVDHIVVAVAADRGLDIGGVGGGDARARSSRSRSGFRRRAAASASAPSAPALPNSDRISMLPTSGALQLKTSGAASERPRISQRWRVFVVGEAGALGAVVVEQVPQARALSPARFSSGMRARGRQRSAPSRVSASSSRLVADRCARP